MSQSQVAKTQISQGHRQLSGTLVAATALLLTMALIACCALLPMERSFESNPPLIG